LAIIAGMAPLPVLANSIVNLAEYVSPFNASSEVFSLTISLPSYVAQNKDAIIVGVIISVIAALLVVIPKKILRLIRDTYYINEGLKPYYDVVWKKSSSLRPQDVLGQLRGRPEGGFFKYYYGRETDKHIQDKIDNGENVLVVGSPLAGKSRAVYQALITLKKPQDVLIPRLVDINPESFRIPFHFKIWRRRVVFLDDIDKFTDIQNFNYLVQEILITKNISMIATCRFGPEYDKLSLKMESDLSLIFGNPINISKISRKEGGEISKKIGLDMPSEFDGNIGSIFIKLDAMRERFKACTDIEKGILRSIKHLYYAGIYDEREVFSIDRIKHVCKMAEEIELKIYEWKNTLNNLKRMGFIDMIEGEKRVLADEVYIQNVIKNGLNIVDTLKYMKNIFSEDPEALHSVGIRAYDFGLVDLKKRDYLRIAIEANREALKVRTPDRFPMDYAMTQNNLGAAYQTLAGVEDKSENCKRAIEAYWEALKVSTIDRVPIQYAATQNNLGNAYRTLSEVEDRSKNCKRAIEAYWEALKVSTIGRFPIQYAATQNNLGNAYNTLAEVEDRSENCKKAIEAYREALKVRTLDRVPMDYAMTQNNLGNAYNTLAEVEDRSENCKKAIEAYREALKVRTLDRVPMDYAMTQNNLGNAYNTLAEVEGRSENCKKAIEAYREALKVRTLDRVPMDYAMTQNNLGNAYSTLAEVEDRSENCKKAIEAYREALKVRTLDRFSMDYAMTQNNLGNAYRSLAEVEDRSKNCKRAIEAYREVLKVSTIDRFPIQYAATQNNLGAAYSTLAEVEDRSENCKRAIEACREALKVFTKEEFPEVHPGVERNLKIILELCRDE
jgi:tetratricopeptide (TPR) repeat protein